MQALTAAVKDDVMAIQKLCKISSSNGAASVYMKSWAVERVVAIMQDLITSYIGSTFERWRDAIRLMKKNEKLVKYLKYQGTRKLELFFEQWLARVVGKRFLTWGETWRKCGMWREICWSRSAPRFCRTPGGAGWQGFWSTRQGLT